MFTFYGRQFCYCYHGLMCFLLFEWLHCCYSFMDGWQVVLFVGAYMFCVSLLFSTNNVFVCVCLFHWWYNVVTWCSLLMKVVCLYWWYLFSFMEGNSRFVLCIDRRLIEIGAELKVDWQGSLRAQMIEWWNR